MRTTLPNKPYYLLLIICFLFVWHNNIFSSAFFSPPPAFGDSGSISGTVYNDQGGVVANAYLEVYSGDPCNWEGWVAYTYTDSNGDYTITGLSTGSYHLIAYESSWNFSEWWADPESTADCLQAQPVQVEDGEAVTGKDFQLFEYASISGTLYDEQGNTLSSGYVELYSSSDPCSSPTLVTNVWVDSDGTYSIGSLNAGSYYLKAHDSTFTIVEWWADTASAADCSQAQIVQVAEAESVSGKNFQLDGADAAANGSISGTVYDGQNNAIVGGNVNLYRGDPCSHEGSFYTTGGETDINGEFTISNLPAGSYYLQAQDSSYNVYEWWADPDSTTGCSQAQVVQIAASESVSDKNFQLDGGTSATAIGGTVYDNKGNTINGGWVYAYNGDPCSYEGYSAGVEIGPDGDYSLTVLDAGSYSLIAHDSSFTTSEWWADPESTPDCLLAQSIEVTEGEVAPERNFQLDMGETISGEIRLPSGVTFNQSTWVNIYIYTASGSYVASTSVTLDAQAEKTSWTVNLPATVQDNIIIYFYSEDIGQLGYVGGYYAGEENTVFERAQALPVSPHVSRDDLHLNFVQGVLFSGEIHLAQGDSITQRLEGYIHLYSDEGDYIDATWFGIDEGTTFTPWGITLTPENLGDVILKINLYTWDGLPDERYLTTCYYNSSTGSKGVMANAERLDGSTGETEIIFLLLKGNLISGQINLTTPDVFPESGSFRMEAGWDGGETTYQYVSYNADDASAGFSIAVPPDATGYTLSYDWWNNFPPYAESGYYSTQYSGHCPADVETLAGGTDHLNINFPFIKSHVIGGQVTVPNGVTLNDDIPVELGVSYVPAGGNQSPISDFTDSITIDITSGAADYSLILPAECTDSPGAYIVGFRHTDNAFVRYGYYNSTATTGISELATPLAADEGHEDINMELMQGNVITGKIELPGSNVAPTEGLAITFGTLTEPGGLYHTTVTIDAGQTEVDYSVRVAPDIGEVALSYLLPESIPYATRGYYSSTATAENVTGRFQLADKFDTSMGVHPDNNFILSEGTLVSGTIHTPGPVDGVAPLEVVLAADPENNESVYWKSTTALPYGDTSVPFEHRIILDGDLTVQYANNLVKEWSPFGFYLDDTSSTRIPSAATALTDSDFPTTLELYIEELLKSDLNNDGSVDLEDAIIGLQIIIGEPVTQWLALGADVNSDGKLSLPEVINVFQELKK